MRNNHSVEPRLKNLPKKCEEETNQDSKGKLSKSMMKNYLVEPRLRNLPKKHEEDVKDTPHKHEEETLRRTMAASWRPGFLI